ncbi:MAG: hypothetical protein QG630_125, partial [Patescibacteria group bacterium]|nr:hypothetical protein [Patescibacteria group bacterium]
LIDKREHAVVKFFILYFIYKKYAILSPVDILQSKPY